MPHQVTVTAKTGPDRQITGAVISNVNEIDFELNDKILRLAIESQGFREFDLQTVSTITISISATKDYTVTVA